MKDMKVNDGGSGQAREAGAGLSEVPRRRFLRHFFLGMAGGAVSGGEWSRQVLAACEPADDGTGIIRLRVSDYPALARANGSVRLALNPFNLSGPEGPFYPLLVNRGFGTQFYAMATRCTHRACVVDPFDARQGAAVCRCHGSRYGLDGTRSSGPAPDDLTRYAATLGADDVLCLQVPDARLNYRLRTLSAANPPNGLLVLTWPTTPGLTYELRRRRDWRAPGKPVAFSLSPRGPSVLEITANADSLTVFTPVPSKHAFYSAAVQLTAG